MEGVGTGILIFLGGFNLSKFWFLNVIPCNRTQFLSVKVPENVKLDKELIKINYGHLSPYEDFDIFYIIQDGVLYLWFIELSKKEDQGSLPECALILLSLKNKEDGVYIFKRSDHCIVNAKKNGVITEQLIVPCEEVDSIIGVLLIKYSFPKENVFYITKVSVGIVDVLITYLKVNFESFVKNLQRKKGYILTAVLVLIYALAVNNVILSFLIERKSSYIRKKVSSILETAKSPQTKFLFLEEVSSVWKQSMNNLSMANAFTVYSEIFKLLESMNLVVQELSFSNSHGKLVVVSPDPKFINLLSKLSYIENLQLVSSSGFGKNSRYFLSFDINLKKIKCK